MPTTVSAERKAVGLFQGCLCLPDLTGYVPLSMPRAKGIPGDQKPAFSSGVPRLSNIFQREMKNPPNKYGKKHSQQSYQEEQALEGVLEGLR